MKKWNILIVILACCLLTACKNDEVVEVETTETEIPGVETLKWIPGYDYSYSEQPDGSLLFTVGGTWESNQSWSVGFDSEGIATVEELSHTEKEVQYLFSPQKAKSGYSEYEIILTNKDTAEENYKFILSLMGNEDRTALSVLEVYFYEPSVEEMTEELTQAPEVTEPASWELQAQKEREAAFTDIVGEISLPEAFTVEGYETVKYTRKEKEEQAGVINFVYKDSHFSCTIAPTIPLSYFQELYEIEEELWEVRMINEIEVSSYIAENSRCIMWKDRDGSRFILIEVEVSGDKGFEVAEIMINQ